MIAEAITAYARTHGRRAFVDRQLTVGASDIGQCARKVFYLKSEGTEYGAARNLGYIESWGATLRGSTFEKAAWVPALRARYKRRLRYAGRSQQTLKLGYLSATPDGLLVRLPANALALLEVPDLGGDRSLALECKTADPRIQIDAPHPEHVAQAQVQLGLFHECTPHRPEWALISYTNASFFDDTREFVVRRDPQIFAVARERANMIMAARSADELRPEGWITGGKECESCPFSGACGRERAPRPTGRSYTPQRPSDPAFVAEIAALAREAKQRESAFTAARSAHRDAQETIKSRLRERGLNHIAGDGISITWARVCCAPASDEVGPVGKRTDRLVIRVT